MFLELSLESHFNTLTSGSIHTDPVDIGQSYVSKIRPVLDKHIREAGVSDSVKSPIALKIVFQMKRRVICTHITYKQKCGHFTQTYIILRVFFRVRWEVF